MGIANTKHNPSPSQMNINPHIKSLFIFFFFFQLNKVINVN